MYDYILSCCSTADLTLEHFKQRDIHFISFHYELDGKILTDDCGQTMRFPDFYNAMANGADTRTSQINADEFIAYFEPFLADGKDVIHLCLSSGITGVMNSALIAKEELLDKYPDRKLIIIDSLAASSGFGLLMDKLADKRDEGMTIDELADWAEANKLRVRHWFFSSDLTFFIKGGRISKTSGFVGTMLGICPLMDVSFEGKLIPRFKIRSKKKVIREIVERMKETADGGADYCDKVYLSQANVEADAEAVASLVEQAFPKMKGKPEINWIGTTIGSHTGPGTVALFYWGTPRDN